MAPSVARLWPADETPWHVRLVADEVWAAIQPLLPAKQPPSTGGRPWIEDRTVLSGVIDVLGARPP